MKHRSSVLSAVAFLALAGSCRSTEEVTEVEAEEVLEPTPEAYSLFGEPLFPMELPEETRAELEANLAEARADYEADPDDPENIIWLGRRLAYLWRYQDAIEVYTEGIEKHPENPKLYRHRGHRYITVRELGKAVSDLTRATELIEGVPDEVEPDGAPNEAGVPRSTLHSNIWYHLGLAHYLLGEFEHAARAYEACMEFSRVNDDMLVATSDWLYMTYRRLGREEEARAVLEPIEEEMDILENHSYHKRLLMYKGLVEPEELLSPAGASDLDLATQGYGVGNWYLVNGDEARAREIFEQILRGSYWAAFGYIAAEADLKRMMDADESM